MTQQEMAAAVPVDLSQWATELIQFPPSFAPTMPAGRESLLFAPGWRTEGSGEVWAYVLLMEIEQPNLDAGGIAHIFDLYYDGLMGSVARNNKPFTIPEDAAQVTIESLGNNHYAGQIQTFDSFKDGSPLTLNFLVTAEYPNPNSTLLKVQASPETPGQNPVWAKLQQAIDSLSFE